MQKSPILLTRRKHLSLSFSFSHTVKKNRRYLGSLLLEADSNGRYLSHPIIKDIDIRPFSRVFDIGFPGLSRKGPPIDIHLWMGTKGATSIRHHDLNDNLYFVLRGHKKFYLSHPNAFRQFEIYPYLHPSHRHEITCPFSPNCDQKRSANILEVDVRAGDLLYLPSFWFHKVVNMDKDTLALNIWWTPKVAKSILKLWDMRIPGENEWNIPKRFIHISYFLENVHFKWEKMRANNKHGYPPFRAMGDPYQMFSVFRGVSPSEIGKNSGFLWMNLVAPHLLTCVEGDGREIVKDYLDLFRDVFKGVCYSVEDERIWKEPIEKVVDILLEISEYSFGAAEMTWEQVVGGLFSWAVEGYDDLIPFLFLWKRL